jgi:hypothetical protein
MAFLTTFRIDAMRGDEPVEMVAVATMPFVPLIGMQLAVMPDGDFFTVESVFWAAGAPEELEVFLEVGGSMPDQDAAFLERQGWRQDA